MSTLKPQPQIPSEVSEHLDSKLPVAGSCNDSSAHELHLKLADSGASEVHDPGASANESFADSERTVRAEVDLESNKKLALDLGYEWFSDLTGLDPWPDFAERIPIQFARQNTMVGVLEAGGKHPGCGRVVVGDINNPNALEAVNRLLGSQLDPILAPPEAIKAAIDTIYQQRSGQTEQLIESLDSDERTGELQSLSAREDLLETASRAPVIKVVNMLIAEAVRLRASDLHIQPYEEALKARFRIDGVLFNAFDLPKGRQEEVVGRIKLMGAMDIAEKRLPQDGRASVQLGNHRVDLRLASLPTNYGERIVIRLLDKDAQLLGLEQLGMDAVTHDDFNRLITKEHGLILVTGPTGSGKTTTLYSALQKINAEERNLLTLEDPIEYQLSGISQTQINEKKGLTFARGLRNVLRQDPDIIMVGEIRDKETAEMAIQSALTGHLVFSTLHTNDAPSAVTRLLDLGIESYLIASSLIGVLAQRLVRRNCSSCGAPDLGSGAIEELRLLGVDPGTVELKRLQRGTGCPECRQTGYRGRVGLFELMVTDDALRGQIQGHAPASVLKRTAVEAGMRTLRDEGLDKALGGMTTIQEVVRMTTGDSD